MNRQESAVLERIERTAKARRDAEAAFKQAVLAAEALRGNGRSRDFTYDKIGEAAGLSAQGVIAIVRRARKKKETTE